MFYDTSSAEVSTENRLMFVYSLVQKPVSSYKEESLFWHSGISIRLSRTWFNQHLTQPHMNYLQVFSNESIKLYSKRLWACLTAVFSHSQPRLADS